MLHELRWVTDSFGLQLFPLLNGEDRRCYEDGRRKLLPWFKLVSSICSFFKLFTQKWLQTYRCKNKNSTQNTHITFTQARLLLNICPTCFVICFLSCALFLTYIHTLLHSHSTHTHSPPRHTFRYTHMPSFVGFLCGVLFENSKNVSEGGRFKRWRESKRGLATFHSSAPAPCLQCIQQALRCSGLEMNYYVDRDQKKYLLQMIVGYSCLSL